MGIAADDKLFKEERLPVLQYMPWIFSIWTVLYLTAVFIYLTTEYTPPTNTPFPIYTLKKSDLGTYTFYSCILTMLPHIIFDRYKVVINLATAVFFVVSVLQLQQLINSGEGLSSYIVASVIYRIVFTNSTTDNFLICLVLTIDMLLSVVPRTNYVNKYFILISTLFVMLYMWAFFVYGCIFLKIHNRISHRTWEHLRALMLLVEKTKRENESCLRIIDNRLPKEMVEYLSSLHDSNSMRCADSFQLKRESALFLKRAGQYSSFITENNSQTTHSCKIVDIAMKEEIILDQNISSTSVITSKLLSIEGFFDRKKSAVIVIHREVTHYGDSKARALASLSEENFQNLLTTLAARRKITFVRMFGGLWIGCVGFFNSWGTDLLNCHSVLEFAGEVSSLESSIVLGKLSIAVEFGDIMGGFQDSFSFELFGQEIRWLLMMVGLRLHGLIILGENIRKLTTGKPKGNRTNPSADAPAAVLGSIVYQCSVRPPWKLNSTLVVNYLSGIEMTLDLSEFRKSVDDFSMRNGVLKKSMFFNDLRYIMDNSDRANNLEFSEASSVYRSDVGNRRTRSRVEQCFELGYPQYKGMYHRLTAAGPSRWEQLTKQLWSQDIGIEFLTSIYERLGLDLKELTSSEQNVRDTMKKFRRIVDQVCFPNLWRCVLLISAYKHSPPTFSKKLKPKQFSHQFTSPYDSLCPIFCRSLSYLKEKFRVNSGSIVSKISFKDIVSFFQASFYDSKSSLSSLPKMHSLNSHSYDEYVDELESSKNSPLYRQQSATLYCDEARLFSHNRVINTMIYFFAHGVAIMSLYYVFSYMGGISNVTPVVALFVGSFVAVIVFEGRYQFLLFLALLSVKITFTVWFAINAQKSLPVGNWNVLGFHMVNYIFTLHDIRAVSILFFQHIVFAVPKILSLSYIKSISYLVVPMLHLMTWGLLHNAYLNFILEHVLVPVANDTYNRQISITNAIRTEFCSKQQPRNDYLLRSRAATAVVAVHIKAIDILSGFLDPRDLYIILRKLQFIIDDCISTCQLSKVSQFSGVTLALVEDNAAAAVSKDNPSVAVQCKIIAFLKAIDHAMEVFNQVNNFELPLGIAISYGSVNMSSSFSNNYDISGYARDIALAMASFQREGIFLENNISAELLQAAGMRSSTYKQVLVEGSTKVMDWLEINGDLSKLQLKNFDYVQMLGKGGYGSVHLLREIHSGILYAIKSIALKDGVIVSAMLKRECIILQMLQHPNVVSLKSSFISNSRLYMVMEYVRGGNLQQVILRDKVSLQHLRFWFAELVLAIEYVHSRGIIHRDIKPVNCMIGTDGHLKLADFGLSKIIDNRKNRRSTNLPSSPATNDASKLMRKETHDKIAQFFPLSQAINSDASRTALLITFDLASDIYTYLRTFSFNVLIASNKKEVEKYLKDKKRAIHAILVDLEDKVDESSMKKLWWFADMRLTFHTMMDSPQAYSRFYSTTLVYVFADCDEKVLHRFKSAGARECFAKPIVHDSLLKTLQRDFGFQDKDFASLPLPLTVVPEEDQQYCSDIVDNVSMASAISCMENSFVDSVEDTLERDNQIRFAVGTIYFLAPEIITKQKYDTPADWWACGITFYECLTQQHLFHGVYRHNVMNCIVNGTIDLSNISSFGEDIHRLVGGFLQRDVKQRLGTDGAAGIKQQEFFAHINWLTLSQSDTGAFKPAQFVQKTTDFHEKLFFYGTVEDRNPQSTLSVMTQRNVASMRRFQLNRGRAKTAIKMRNHSKSTKPKVSALKARAGDWDAPASIGESEDEQPSICEEDGEEEN